MIKRICSSLKSRIQRWESRHFEWTKYGRSISSLKGKHEGMKCVIVGNGPSLKAEDLQALHDHRIITFAANRIYHIFDQTDWRPTYYASEDIQILSDIQKLIPTIPAEKHFIPVNLKWYEGIDVPGADYFYMNYHSEGRHGLSLNAAHEIGCKGTVTVTCIQLAVYMGFTDIYLIGVDHSYSRSINDEGKVIENPDVKDYFTDRYEQGIRNPIMRNLDTSTRGYQDVENLSREMKTFRVLNATRGGKLETFQRVSFDEILKPSR